LRRFHRVAAELLPRATYDDVPRARRGRSALIVSSPGGPTGIMSQTTRGGSRFRPISSTECGK